MKTCEHDCIVVYDDMECPLCKVMGELEDANKTIEKLEINNDGLNEDIKQLNDDITDYRREIKDLERERDDLEWELEQERRRE